MERRTRGDDDRGREGPGRNSRLAAIARAERRGEGQGSHLEKRIGVGPKEF